MKRENQPADDELFLRYLAWVRRGHLHADGVPMERIKAWEADPRYRSWIDGARTEWKQRLDRIQKIKPLRLGQGHKLPPNPCDEDDPSTLAFNAKILPNIEKDIETGSVYTEATLAAMNLPGWADAIARYARAAHDGKRGPLVKKFFVELGKALASGRTLWDQADELIFCNYYASTKFKKPLSQMTEEEGSALIGLSVAAYDKRLQRLGLRRKGGRPRKQDKSSRTRS
jgi:hypothetical protein